MKTKEYNIPTNLITNTDFKKYIENISFEKIFTPIGEIENKEILSYNLSNLLITGCSGSGFGFSINVRFSWL